MTRVAVIGGGARSVAHMVAVTHIPDVEVVGVTDIDESRAAAAVERANSRRKEGSEPHQPRLFTDYRDMLAATDPDCIYLCLPPFVHGEIDHAVIDAGKAVLFEKPVALSVSLAQEIADHIREKGIVNAVGYQKRYSSAIQKVAELLKDTTIGMAVSIRFGDLPSQPWWRVQSQSGGMLVEQHTHAVDMMRVTCGEIESVYAMAATRLLNDVPNVSVFDVNAVTVRFANGAPGIIGNSCAAEAGASIFPGHTVQVAARDMVITVHSDRSVVHRVGQPPEEFVMEQNDNYLMNKAFIEAARAGNQGGILCDFADGAQTLAVTLACQESAEKGELVRVPIIRRG
jgi:myo-inositol 2-dehydrogenase/D-chiro-inositol 1-dehydrogenase